MVKALPDDMHVLTGSYVLDALSEVERADFERHLQRCPSCGAEVRGLRETAARLAMAKTARPPAQLEQRVAVRGLRETAARLAMAKTARPPAQLEQRVLAATYRTRQLPPLGSERLRRARRPAGPDRKRGGEGKRGE